MWSGMSTGPLPGRRTWPRARQLPSHLGPEVHRAARGVVDVTWRRRKGTRRRRSCGPGVEVDRPPVRSDVAPQATDTVLESTLSAEPPLKVVVPPLTWSVAPAATVSCATDESFATANVPPVSAGPLVVQASNGVALARRDGDAGVADRRVVVRAGDAPGCRSGRPSWRRC